MSIIEFKSVRLAYPNIFTRGNYLGKETKYSAKLLFNKDDNKEQLASVQAEIAEMVKTNKIKVDASPKGNMCMLDGDVLGNDNYENC